MLLGNDDGEFILPSVVHLGLDQKIVAGFEAEATEVVMPERTISVAKRSMGETEYLQLGPNQLSPKETTALILKELKQRAVAYYELADSAPIEAVTTVPRTSPIVRDGRQKGWVSWLGSKWSELLMSPPPLHWLPILGVKKRKRTGYCL